MTSVPTIDIMRLRTWALSCTHEGARSPFNWEYLEVLLRWGYLADAPLNLSGEDMAEQGVPGVRLRFHLPQEFHCNGVAFISVLVPRAFVGTGTLGPDDIFSSLIEEIAGWLAGSGPQYSLVRLSHRQHPESPGSERPFGGFATCINELRQEYYRQDHYRFPDVGEISGAFGVMQVTSSRDGSAGFTVILILENRHRVRVFVPQCIAVLPFAFVLDWIEAQERFASRR